MAKRDIGPLLQRWRAFLLGREHTKAGRFEYDMSNRTQPPPDIPGGPAHTLSANYYYQRDARREVQQPIDLMQGKLLEAEGAGGPPKPGRVPTPGRVFKWD